MTGMPGEQEPDLELAQTFADVARVLLEDNDVDTTLERICHLAVETVAGCETAGVSIASSKKVTSRSSTDELPRILDDIQSETQEGPCVDAIKEHEVFLTGSLSQEARWPNFARRAHEETGVQSILSLRLFASETTLGALNLYSGQVDAFDDQDIAVGSVFAAHAAVALSNARQQADLEQKAESRNVIGMAKGIVMARQHVSDTEAFDILRRASQRMNVKLRDLAAQVANAPLGERPPSTG
jgi:GAF domain-containing protein